MNTITRPAGQGQSDRALKSVEATTSGRTTGSRSLVQQFGRIVLLVLKWLALSMLALLSSILVLACWRAGVLASLIWGPTHWAEVFPLAVLLLGLMVLLVLGLARFDRWRV